MKFVFFLLVCLLTSPANATMIYDISGLSGTFETENFDSNAGHQTAAASQFAGITFGNGNYVSNDYVNSSFPNMTNSVIANFYPCCQDPTSFSFDFALSDLAFAFVSNQQTTTFSAYLNNSLVESSFLATNLSGNYITISGITFDEIRITSVGNNDAYLIDDMQFIRAVSQVPEPATLSLLGIGLTGIVFSRKRRDVI